MGVLRAIGFGLGVSGAELQERTNIAPEDLCDVVNTLLDMGFAELTSMKQSVCLADYASENIEINPSYISELKTAMRQG